jgi:hypothetical protein
MNAGFRAAHGSNANASIRVQVSSVDIRRVPVAAGVMTDTAG